jgi:hypothetical protein
MATGGKRRQHEVRTYDLLRSLALTFASPVRGDCRPCDPASAVFQHGQFAFANENRGATLAAGKRSAA